MVLPFPRGERAAAILEALRAQAGSASRTEIANTLNVARATLSEALAELEDSDLILQHPISTSTGGRPPQKFQINPNAAHIGIIDVGGSRTRVGVANLDGELLKDALLSQSVEMGPETILNWATTELNRLFIETASLQSQKVIVVGLPGPVDFNTGYVVRPPMMRNWQGFDVRAHVYARIPATVIIDNDVNLIALAEQRISHPTSQVLLVIKLGTGVGGGLVINGRPLRGANGAAGDIGHTQATQAHGTACRCGQTGCVEALAGGWALVQKLVAQGFEVENVTDVANLAKDGNPVAISHVQTAAKVVGQAAAQAVSLINPDTVVIAGELLTSGDTVIAIIRETIYQFSLPLATHDLTLKPSELGALVGLKGGAQLGIDYLFGRVEFAQLATTIDQRKD
jgi:predicted NBD/HSP70 family sugar kinase